MVHPAAAKSWHLLIERLETETDPIRRRNLDVVARHVVAEVAGDLAALEETLVENPRYTFWGGEAPRRLSGRNEVRGFYQHSVDAGKNRLAFDISRVLVDAASVVTEGVFRHVLPGSELAGRRLPNAEPVRPQILYLTEYHALVVWPITDEGLIAGEEIYLGEPHQLRRAVEPGEFPHLGRA